jgi:hypothetical protein
MTTPATVIGRAGRRAPLSLIPSAPKTRKGLRMTLDDVPVLPRSASELRLHRRAAR